MPKKSFERTIGILSNLAKLSTCASVFAICLIIIITASDVCLRTFFNKSIMGATELSELLLVVVAFPALGRAALNNKHVKVDILVNKIRLPVRETLSRITMTLSAVVVIMLTAASLCEAPGITNRTSMLEIPLSIFYWIMCVGYGLFLLSMFLILVSDKLNISKKGTNGA